MEQKDNLEVENNETVKPEGKKNGKKTIFLIIFLVVVLCAAVLVMFISKGMLEKNGSSEESNNVVEKNESETDNNEDINDSDPNVNDEKDNYEYSETKELNGYKMVSKYVEDGTDIIQTISIYKGEELAKEIKDGFYIEEITINNTVLYEVTVEVSRGGVFASCTKILDKDFNVFLETNDLPQKNSFMHEEWFNPVFNDKYIVIWVQNEACDYLYLYYYKCKLVKTIDNRNIAGINNNYFLVQDETKFNLMDFENNLVVTMFDTSLEEYKNFELSSEMYSGTCFAAGIDEQAVGVFVRDVTKEYTGSPDYIISYSFIDKKVTKVEFSE